MRVRVSNVDNHGRFIIDDGDSLWQQYTGDIPIPNHNASSRE